MSTAHEILVVDDDALVNEFFEAVLKRLGHRVTTVASGEQGLQLIREREFDIVLSDVKMPRMSGIDLLKQAKTESPETVVIMITAYGTVKDAVEAMKLGAFDYILKPILPDELEMIVAKALEHRQLILENRILRSEIRGRYQFENIVGADKKLLSLLETLSSAAKSRATILIRGESGTGKELIARAIHYNSPRANGPFVTLNCAALPEGLIESELFGHEKGSFSGADKTKIGKLEAANGGTLYIPEVSSLTEAVQLKLLQFMQYKSIARVGQDSRRPETRLDVRVIMATNESLEEEVKKGRMREDFYHRISGVKLLVPPLRMRREDIGPLTEYFLKKYDQHPEGERHTLAPEVLQSMQTYRWPGNVRELENSMKGALVYASGRELNLTGFPMLTDRARDESQCHICMSTRYQHLPPYEEVVLQLKKGYFEELLSRVGGSIPRAAEVAGMSAQGLRKLLKTLEEKAEKGREKGSREYVK